MKDQEREALRKYVLMPKETLTRVIEALELACAPGFNFAHHDWRKVAPLLAELNVFAGAASERES